MQQEPNSATGPTATKPAEGRRAVAQDDQKTWVQQQITLPNIIAIVSIIAGAGMMWSSTEARDAEQDRRLTNAEAALALTQQNATEILKAIAMLQADVKYLSRSIEQQQQMPPASRGNMRSPTSIQMPSGL